MGSLAYFYLTKPPDINSNKRVVIIGGGYGGANVALRLEKSFNVTLIDNKDYMIFTPAIVKLLLENDAEREQHLPTVRLRHEDYLRYGTFKKGKVIEVTKDNNVLLESGESVPFDELVISSGSRYAAPWKSLEIQHIDALDNSRSLKEWADKIQHANRIIIIGGGPVGVELAAEISSRIPNKKVILFTSHDRLLHRRPEKASKGAEDVLKDSQVEIWFNKRVIQVESVIKFSDDSDPMPLHADDVVFNCMGIHPNAEFMKKNFSEVVGNSGKVKVGLNLQVENQNDMWAIGDVADLPEDLRFVTMHVPLVVDNIIYHELGMDDKMQHVASRWGEVSAISLGKKKGIAFMGSWVSVGGFGASLKNVGESILMGDLNNAIKENRMRRSVVASMSANDSQTQLRKRDENRQ
eukprot:TRINITY_DN1332_c0_g4_i2.p1 TRINITY_DN1332_c0_g4~~TRINITY_DN1332_c0_g4_i2.p1  ORF type:complete len:469 (-),score=179.84 TRINITY_DN1332_c0_g4_i2:93-1316(-)